MTVKDKQEEFLRYYEPVQSKLSAFARAITRNSEQARDLVSETILVAYEKFDRIKDKQSFQGFLFTVAIRMHKRWIWRRRLFGSYDEQSAENIIGQSVNPENNIDIQILYKSLDKLSPKMRETIVLFEISGFSLEEIKQIQGGTLSGVKSRLKRGREQLELLMRSATNEIEVDYNIPKGSNNTSVFRTHKINGFKRVENNIKVKIENER